MQNNWFHYLFANNAHNINYITYLLIKLNYCSEVLMHYHHRFIIIGATPLPISFKYLNTTTPLCVQLYSNAIYHI